MKGGTTIRNQKRILALTLSVLLVPAAVAMADPYWGNAWEAGFMPELYPAVRADSYERAYIGNCKEWVTVWDGPGTDSVAIDKVYLDEVVYLLQWNREETWCKVFYNDFHNVGWVSGDFLLT